MKPESQEGPGPESASPPVSTAGGPPAASASTLSTSPPLSIVELLCPSLLVDPKTSKPTQELIKDKSLVLLYFSAHWCPPCKAFTPKLRDFYMATRRQHPLEIVYVSSDRTLAEFNEYFGTSMPWLAVGASDDASVEAKNRLAQALRIRSIPSLVVLRREKPGVDNWLYVTDRARDQVSSSASPESLVKEWMEMPAVPLSEAASLEGGGGGGGAGSTLKEIVMTVLRNPMYLFALIYLVKYLVRTHLSPSSAKDAAQRIDEDPFGSSHGDGAGDESEF